jgi:hypothetical protein
LRHERKADAKQPAETRRTLDPDDSRSSGRASAETADALQELVDVIRAIEGRLSALKGKGAPRHTDEMTLPNRK